jgi:hypothetical protein
LRAFCVCGSTVRSLSRAYRELLAMSEIITDSPLDWTIARFTQPTDRPGTGSILIATFLLEQTTDPRFHRAAPAISN